ncbi:MAG: efflux RND transporter periplasmic adaptor subunit [Bacillaceae bacterium]|nr:efflux RND transporter periplasmic adaptor subunit [Bacillaceae bacterium]
MRAWIIVTATACSFLLLLNIYLLATNDEFKRTKVISQVSFSKQTDLLDTISSSGMVVPLEEQSVVYEPSYGEIEEIMVHKGDDVTAGTPLLKYVDIELNRNIDLSLGNINKIEFQIDKIENDINDLFSQLTQPVDGTFEEHSIYYVKNLIQSQINEKSFQKQLLDIELNNIKTQIELLEQKQDRQTITSKMDGIVVNVNENITTPNHEIVKLQSSDIFQVRGSLSEYDITSINEGQKAYVQVKSQENSRLEGYLHDITMVPIQEPLVEDEMSHYPYILNLVEPSEHLHHGFHVDVDFVLIEKEGVVAVPADSVVKSELDYYIFIFKNGKIEKRLIQTGIELDNLLEVTEGLEHDERIIAKPSIELQDGMRGVMPIQISQLQLADTLKLTKAEVTRLIFKGIFNY